MKMMVTQSANEFVFQLLPGQAAAPPQPGVPSIVLTFPLLSGKVEAWRRFCQELAGSRRFMYTDSRRRLGVTRERMTLRDTPSGAAATTTLDAPNVGRVLARLILSPLPFESWYREQLQELHGISLTAYELYARALEPIRAPDLTFDWRAS